MKWTLTTSKGTKYVLDTIFARNPASPLTIPIRVVSFMSKSLVCPNNISFDTSSEVRPKTLPGIDPKAEVPKPLKIPGTPSVFSIFRKTDNPFIWALAPSATCILVFTSVIGCRRPSWSVKREAPIMWNLDLSSLYKTRRKNIRIHVFHTKKILN